MKQLFLAVLAAAVLSLPAFAALKPGAVAPEFSVPASLAGKEFNFSLAEALKKGPVVLYFYPAAFTPGCTAEAHEFAEAIEKYSALSATVIGVSSDDIETLHKFSVSECRSKFAVAADGDLKVAKAYDAVLARFPAYAKRTSYVITPDGRIIYEYTDLDYSQHVENTLAALQKWKSEQK
jgi:peroxiredoxin